MTQQAEMLRKIDRIPPKYFNEVIDFLGYVLHKAQQEVSDNELEKAAMLPTGNNGKLRFTREELDEMVKNSPTLHKLSGILHTDMTIDEIRMARLAKHL
jgi:hypothetical protein